MNLMTKVPAITPNVLPDTPPVHIRHKLYALALEVYTFKYELQISEHRTPTGICKALSSASDILKEKRGIILPDPYIMMDCYPEIFDRKPKRLYDVYWWKPTNKAIRIAVLKQAIKLTKEQTT